MRRLNIVTVVFFVLLCLSNPAVPDTKISLDFLYEKTNPSKEFNDGNVPNHALEHREFRFLSATGDAFSAIRKEYKAAIKREDYEDALTKMKIIIALIEDKWGEYSNRYRSAVLQAAMLAVDAEEYEQAEAYFQKSILLGNTKAFSRYANFLKEDKPGWVHPRRITYLLEVGAELGEVRSMIDVGWRYYRLRNTLDFEKAFHWTSKAAEIQGKYRSYALNNLAVMYESGFATKRDQKKAIDLYKRAERMGNHWAPGNLGRIYYLGLGVKPNVALARDYFQRSIARNEDEVAKFFTRMMEITNNRILAGKAEIIETLIKVTLEGQDEGYPQLGWFLSKDDKTEAAKWFWAGRCFSKDAAERSRNSDSLNVIYQLFLEREEMEQARAGLIEFYRQNRTRLPEKSQCNFLN